MKNNKSNAPINGEKLVSISVAREWIKNLDIIEPIPSVDTIKRMIQSGELQGKTPEDDGVTHYLVRMTSLTNWASKLSA